MLADIAPYGSWKSPITTEMIIEGSIKFQEIHCEGDNIYWLEGRPAEKGRSALVYYALDGKPVDLAPSISIRSRVHEYGGGAFNVSKGTIYFSNNVDQQLYRLGSLGQITPITQDGKKRFADSVITPDDKALICICEDHTSESSVVNSLMRIDLEGKKRSNDDRFRP